MTKLEAINKVWQSPALAGKKHALSVLLSEWECFTALRQQYPDKGLMEACYKEIGVKFYGIYSVKTYDDIIKLAYEGL